MPLLLSFLQQVKACTAVSDRYRQDMLPETCQVVCRLLTLQTVCMVQKAQQS